MEESNSALMYFTLINNALHNQEQAQQLILMTLVAAQCNRNHMHPIDNTL